ncbi:sugar diacid recognition domain-containing protein [Alteribacillus sp. YIM 98480]|uniref:CdaR family transcriptional regulator n=1 Tax=Alteribacillus sp. YIM 98480 TaxID=2606599 RepID=UPI00131B2C54|nr:sugar diacid recognition domain-containing protein [Alteribacillus sp. YIM 98480]
MLTKTTAMEIAKKTTAICGYNILIIDEKGNILGSGDVERVGHYHGGVQEVVKFERILMEKQDEAIRNQALPGVVLPIKVDHNIIGAVGITGNPEDVFKFGKLIQNQVEMMCMQEMSHHISTLKLQSQKFLIQELLENDPDRDKIEKLADLLNLDLHKSRVAISVRLLHPSLDYVIKDVLNQLIIDKKNTIFAHMKEDHWIMFLPYYEYSYYKIKTIYERILKNFGNCCLVGIGKANDRIKGYRTSYKQAENALFIGKKLRGHGIFNIEDYWVEELMWENESKTEEDLSQFKWLKKLNPYKTPLLVETINAFCKYNLNVSVTAKHLYIHRNTLLYRLDKIEDETGLNPKNFHELMELWLINKLFCLK